MVKVSGGRNGPLESLSERKDRSSLDELWLPVSSDDCAMLAVQATALAGAQTKQKHGWILLWVKTMWCVVDGGAHACSGSNATLTEDGLARRRRRRSQWDWRWDGEKSCSPQLWRRRPDHHWRLARRRSEITQCLLGRSCDGRWHRHSMMGGEAAGRWRERWVGFAGRILSVVRTRQQIGLGRRARARMRTTTKTRVWTVASEVDREPG